MATRTILTSQPVLSCDICERRLLRGEHHDVFIEAGERRTVCELCAPRAAHEGWLRERDIDAETDARPRQRPARGLLERLRRGLGAGQRQARTQPVRRSASEALGTPAEPARAFAGFSPAELAPEPDPLSVADADLLAVADADLLAVADAELLAAGASATLPATEEHEPLLAPGSDLILRAVQAFNDSELPRRVRGLARSLGEPAVCVRPAEHVHTAVRVVVAWELCWYRYEIDFGEDEPSVRALAQGTQLAELEREERSWNAAPDADGTIALIA